MSIHAAPEIGAREGGLSALWALGLRRDRVQIVELALHLFLQRVEAR